MFDWLFEGLISVYIFLAALVVILFIVWWQNRWRWCLFCIVAGLLLIGLYHLLDRLVETDREQIRHKIEQMATAVEQRDLDRAWVHMSDQLRTPGQQTKQQFRLRAQQELNADTVSAIKVWGFSFLEDPNTTTGTALIEFSGKFLSGRAGRDLYFRCEASFILEPSHGWRMKSFKVFDPMTTNAMDLGI